MQKTIGSLLKSLRLKSQQTIEDISSRTNIAPHLLAYLEEDNYAQLPTSTFTKGFINNYAKVVDLDPEKALAIFRRDFTISESGKIMPRGLAKPLDKKTYITSKMIWGLSASLFVLLTIGYIAYQLKNFHTAPSLTISQPRYSAIVKGPIISVKGTVTPDSTVYTNGTVAQVQPTGEFVATVQLPAGEQEIKVRAVNAQQLSTETRIPVTVIDK